VVSINHGGDDDYPARDAGAMASRRFPPLLVLEIPEPGRPATNPRQARVVLKNHTRSYLMSSSKLGARKGLIFGFV